MYQAFFGLAELPFSITPDPRYLFLSARHSEALAHLFYGVSEAGGFIQLTGEVGTGKTTIVRSLLAREPADVDIALVLNPRVTVAEFLVTLCEELSIPLAETERASIKTLMDKIGARLLEAHAAGRRVAVLIDEAHLLERDVLEQVRLLTNLETATRKLLQIILIGQPELRDLLAREDLRQVAQHHRAASPCAFVGRRNDCVRAPSSAGGWRDARGVYPGCPTGAAPAERRISAAHQRHR